MTILNRSSLGLLLTAALAAACASATGGDGGDDNGDDGGGIPGTPARAVVFEDDFNGVAGSLPNASRWGFDVGTDWGNAQLEYDTDRAENTALDGNGNLVITARQESFQGSAYTSARMTTAGKFEPTYGRFEARIKLPTGRGIWPAFWLLGADIETVGWPETGEIDILEFRGQEPTVMHHTVHGPGYSAGSAVTRRYEFPGGRLDTDFHVYAVEWTPDSIEWFIDDVLYFRVTPESIPGRWVFDHPFYIILNVAVGGSFVGPPDATTNFPQSMIIDWVRVYEPKT